MVNFCRPFLALSTCLFVVTSVPSGNAPHAADWLAKCRIVQDSSSLADCLWDLESVYARGDRPAGPNAAYLPPPVVINAGKVFGSMLREMIGEPVGCSSLHQSLLPVLQDIEYLTRSKLGYRPDSCPELEKLFKTIMTLPPLWTKCPNGAYSTEQLTICFRAFLDASGREAAIRHFYQLAGSTPADRRAFFDFKAESEVLKDLEAFSAQSKRNAVAEADQCVRTNNHHSYISLKYAALVAGSSPSRVSVPEIANKVTCRDIIQVVQSLELPNAPSSARYESALPGIEAANKAAHEAWCQRGNQPPTDDAMKAAMNRWLHSHCNKTSAWMAALTGAETNSLAVIGLSLGAIEFLESEPNYCKMRSVTIIYNFTWDVMTAESCVSSADGGFECKSTNMLKCSTDLQNRNPQRDAFDCAPWRSLRIQKILAKFDQQKCDWEAFPVPTSH